MAISSRPFLLSRRNFLVGSGAALVAGCSHTPSLQLVGDSFSQTFSSSAAYPRTRAEVEALPYAQLGVRFNKGARGIMVLSEKAGDQLHWVSANRLMLATRNGRLVRTVGLQTDLMNTQLYGQDLLDRYNPDVPSVPDQTLARTVDAGSAYGVPIRSSFKIEGSETITILDQQFDTWRVRETMDSDLWRWRADNYYWISKRSALAWRSIQALGPDLPTIEMEMLKRPA